MTYEDDNDFTFPPDDGLEDAQLLLICGGIILVGVIGFFIGVAVAG